MKKTFKKSIAIFLCILMIFSCVAVSVSAATKETVRQYSTTGGYLAIGDSIGRGCGSTGSYKDRDGNPLDECGGQYDDNEVRYVEGSYTAQIADAVGCEAPKFMSDSSGNYWPCCFGGMTTAVALDLYGIDDGYSDTRLNYSYYDVVLDYFGYEGSSVGAKGETFDAASDGRTGNIIDVTKQASLITIELGMCDIFYRAYRVISNGGLLADGISLDSLSADTISGLVTTAVDLLEEGYNNWLKQYPMLLERVMELNPDAEIVIIGSFNMVNQMTLLDQSSFPLGSIFSNITDKMNEQYEKWAKKYGVLYANIENCESLATEADWSVLGEFLSGNNSFPGSHPAQNGYDYITRQILGVLPEAGKYDNITVDIGRFTEETVKSVKVNGITVTDYEIKDHVLTIPYTGSLACSLTLTVVDGDGNEGFQYYKLTHLDEGGYSAYRVFGNNNTKNMLTKPFELIKFLFETLADLIKGLFD